MSMMWARLPSHVCDVLAAAAVKKFSNSHASVAPSLIPCMMDLMCVIASH